MYKSNQQLITDRGVNGNITCNDPAILNDVNNAITAINVAGGALPNHPPFEKHPYLNLADYQMQDFEKYIIGTFPPISYILDLLGNPAIQNLIKPNGGGIFNPPITPFFHGNDLALWKFLLTNIEWVAFNALPNRLEKKQYLIDLLYKNKINYSDIIYTVQRANNEYSVADNDLKNICPNLCLITHILNNKNAQNLNFNTSSVFNGEGLNVRVNNPAIGRVNTNHVKSYDLFLRTLQDLGFDLQIDLLNGDGWIDINANNSVYLSVNYHFKILTKLKIKLKKTITICENEFDSGIEREFKIITGATPSGFAYLTLGNNPVYQEWHALNINALSPFDAFRQHIYQLFRAGNWAALQAMNI